MVLVAMVRLSAIFLFRNALAVRVTQLVSDTRAVQQNEILSRPSICSDDIVRETGMLTDTSNTDRQTICTPSKLRELLSASEKSMADLWKELDLPFEKDKSSMQSVPCSDVCKAVARVLKSNQRLPPASDTGCTIVSGEQLCNIDLTPSGISGLVDRQRSLPDFHDKEIIDQEQALEDKNAQAEAVKGPNVEGPVSMTIQEPHSSEKLFNYNSWSLLRKVANLFRIYPASMASATEVQSTSSLAEAGTTFATGWLPAVLKKNEEARAVLVNAIRKFRAKQTSTELTMWFGKEASSDETLEKEILRILNSVDNMLDQVEYVFPGEECTPNTYAYVYPSAGPCQTALPGKGQRCTKNKDGKFLFYLCPLYMNRVDEQIEVLLHEGSHHFTARTNDVCMDEFYMGYNASCYLKVPTSKLHKQVLGELVWIQTPIGYPPNYFDSVGWESLARVWKVDGQTAVVKMLLGGQGSSCDKKAYGRTTCKKLTKLSSMLAIRNADNFCYYVSDIGAASSKKPELLECMHTGDFCVGDHVSYTGQTFINGNGEKVEPGDKGVVIFPGFQNTEAPYSTGDKVQVLMEDSWISMTVSETKPLKAQLGLGGFSFDLGNDRVRNSWGQEHVFVRFVGKRQAAFVDNNKLVPATDLIGIDLEQPVEATFENDRSQHPFGGFTFGGFKSGCFHTFPNMALSIILGSSFLFF